MVKKWSKIKSFDDLIQPEEREVISEIEKKFERKCPHLRKIGKFFYYCGKDLNGNVDENQKPSPFNPIYQNSVDIILLQLYCMDKYESCCFYSGKLKH